MQCQAFGAIVCNQSEQNPPTLDTSQQRLDELQSTVKEMLTDMMPECMARWAPGKLLFPTLQFVRLLIG